MDELSEELAHFFLVHDYKWRLDIGLVNPDADDIKRAIERACQILDDQDEYSQLEVGHLLFRKNAGVVDVFLHAGTIGEDNEDSSI